MKRYLKRTSLALAAVLCLSAASAAAAQAENTFMAKEYPVTLHGAQIEKNTFTYGGNTVTCEKATFESNEVKAASSEVEITPKYEECHVNFLGSILPETVTKENIPEGKLCYKFKVTETDPTEPTNKDKAVGTVTIQCKFTIHIYASAKEHEESVTNPEIKGLCTLTVEPQGPLAGVTYENQTVPGHVVVKANVTNVKVKRDGSSLCGAEAGEATYKGNTTVEGKNGEGAADPVTVEME